MLFVSYIKKDMGTSVIIYNMLSNLEFLFVYFYKTITNVFFKFWSYSVIGVGFSLFFSGLLGWVGGASESPCLVR